MSTEIPDSLVISSVIATVLFFGAALGLFHWGLAKTDFSKNKKLITGLLVSAGLIGWYVFVLWAGIIGFFAEETLIAPNIVLTFIILAFTIRRLYKSVTIQTVFEKIPAHWLIAVQIFRLMGYVFLTLYVMGILPGFFAIPTGLGDVFIGITAPFLAYIVYSKKSSFKNLALAWNYLGIADLVMAITLGILTYSWLYQAVPTDVPSNPIAQFPLIIIPVFAVPLSIILHLFTIRNLKRVY